MHAVRYACSHYLAEICTPLCLCLSAEDISVLQRMATLKYLAPERPDMDNKDSLWNTLPPTVCDPSLTLTQFCALLKHSLSLREQQMQVYTPQG